jgi:hypothetical protein
MIYRQLIAITMLCTWATHTSHHVNQQDSPEIAFSTTIIDTNSTKTLYGHHLYCNIGHSGVWQSYKNFDDDSNTVEPKQYANDDLHAALYTHHKIETQLNGIDPVTKQALITYALTTSLILKLSPLNPTNSNLQEKTLRASSTIFETIELSTSSTSSREIMIAPHLCAYGITTDPITLAFTAHAFSNPVHHN